MFFPAYDIFNKTVLGVSKDDLTCSTISLLKSNSKPVVIKNDDLLKKIRTETRTNYATEA